jgi:hypothetical protein
MAHLPLEDLFTVEEAGGLTAMRLYQKVAERSGFVVYRKQL